MNIFRNYMATIYGVPSPKNEPSNNRPTILIVSFVLLIAAIVGIVIIIKTKLKKSKNNSDDNKVTKNNDTVPSNETSDARKYSVLYGPPKRNFNTPQSTISNLTPEDNKEDKRD